MAAASHRELLLLLPLVLQPWSWAQASEDSDFINCHREGQSCVTGLSRSCSDDGQTCVCTSNATAIQGYYCLDDSVAGTTCVSNPCQNNHTCVVDNGLVLCICSESVAGELCQHPRLEVDCSNTDMTVTVRPFGEAFSGKVYPRGHDTDSCRLASSILHNVSVTGASFFELSRALAFNSCGMTFSTLQDGTSRYAVTLIVQYTSSPDILQSSDQSLQATCDFSPNTSLSLTLGNITFDNASSDTATATGQLDMDMFIMDDNNLLVGQDSPPVLVGDDLTIHILMPDNEVFQRARVEACTASSRANSSDTENYASLPLIANACPVSSLVTENQHVVSNPSSFELRINVVAFLIVKGSSSYTNQLHFQCDVTRCTADNLASCDIPTVCDSSAGQPTQRRRRSVEEAAAVVGRTILVTFNTATQQPAADDTDANDNTPPSPAHCLRLPELQTIIVVLGVVMFALLLVSVTLIILFCRHRRLKRMEETR